MVCSRPESCDAPRALMSVAPNHCCEETRTENHTLAWHLWCPDSDLTWLKQPPHSPCKKETKHSRSPTQRRMQRKPSARELTRGLSCWKPGQRKNELSRKLTQLWPPVKVGGSRSYGWKDMPKQNLNSFTISLFLFPWTPGKQMGGSGCSWGTLERLLFGMSQRHYLLDPSSCYTSRWGFFCPYSSLCQESGQWKLWAPVRYLANFLAGYEGDFLARFPHCFFLLFFSRPKIRGGFVRIQREAHFWGCGPLPRGRAVAMECGLARFFRAEVNSYANEREDHPSHWGTTQSSIFWQCLRAVLPTLGVSVGL